MTDDILGPRWEKVGNIDITVINARERLDHIEAILRAQRMHEPSCSSFTGYVLPNGEPHIDPSACDCWLSEATDV